MRESDLLRLIRERSVNLGPGVLLGPGDDCAALDPAVVGIAGGGDRGVALLVTVDQVVEGRHFAGPLGAAPADGGARVGATAIEDVARKSVARSVSDIAAMGGRPLWAIATGALPPRLSQAQADRLFEAMARWARHWGCPLVGGDIALLGDAGEHSAVLTVTVIGAAHPARGPVRRDAARAGDSVYVTGHIGGSLASGRHLSFEPRVREGSWLAGALGTSLHAMIDLSDGLGRDAARIAEASGVRLEIEDSAVPMHAGCGPANLGDGEDYELLFTAADGVQVPESCPETGVRFSRIGRVVAGSGCVLMASDGTLRDAASLGWDHATRADAGKGAP